MPHNITDSAWTGPDLKPEEEKRAAQKTLAVLEEMADVFKGGRGHEKRTALDHGSGAA